MNRFGALTLSTFAGWTLACHVATLLHASLYQAFFLAIPFVAVAAALLWRSDLGIPVESRMSATRMVSASHWYLPILPLAALLALLVSWTAFWAFSCIAFATLLFISTRATPCIPETPSVIFRREWCWVGLCGAAAALLTLAISRSDLDDAYYVAVAAFGASHPHAALLANDPMYGEPGWTLPFPSYRFSAYEPLAALLARALGIPAMDVMYRVLPPIAAIYVVAAIFYCSRQLLPRRWLASGICTLLLMILLGETHQGAANFGFVRLFQGKAIFLSVMVPVIYGLCFRYASDEGRKRDLALLALAMVGSIGLSNFAILCAPLTVVIAAISAAPPFSRKNIWRCFNMAAISLLALPYLVFVMVQSHAGEALAGFAQESPHTVWLHVYGSTQQYFIAALLLSAPIFALNPTTRWRLALPPFILFAVFLNPWLAPYISTYITSPPVYWRVTWIFPALIYLGAGICLIANATIDRNKTFPATAILLLCLFVFGAMSVPLNAVRPANFVKWDFAGRKVDPTQMAIAQQAMDLNQNHGRVLAPDEISGLMTMYESHPKLVNVRMFYLDLFASQMPPIEYEERKMLSALVVGQSASGPAELESALNKLDVTTVVMADNRPDYPLAQTALKATGFSERNASGPYITWTRPSASSSRAD
jgi:hypothetical protein